MNSKLNCFIKNTALAVLICEKEIKMLKVHSDYYLIKSFTLQKNQQKVFKIKYKLTVI